MNKQIKWYLSSQTRGLVLIVIGLVGEHFTKRQFFHGMELVGVGLLLCVLFGSALAEGADWYKRLRDEG